MVIEDRFANKDYFKNAIQIINNNLQNTNEDKALNLLYVVATRL